MSGIAPTPEAEDVVPKINPSAAVQAAMLTGLSFGAAMRTADPDNGVVAGIAWAGGAGLALLAAGDSLKSHGLITKGNFKSSAARLTVRMGAMVGSLMAAEHMVNNPENMTAFGIAAAATIVGAAIAATTFDAPSPARARKPGP